MAVIQIEFARCGFGLSAGLAPEVRFGFVRVTTLSRSIVRFLQANNDDLRATRDAFRAMKKRWIKSSVQIADLEGDLRASEGIRRQLTMDLTSARDLADERAVTVGAQSVMIRDLKVQLEPFTRRWKQKVTQ